MRIVELDAAGNAAVEIVPLGVGRSLCTIEGGIEQLLREPKFARAEEAWVRVILSDEVLPLQAMARLRERFPHVAELRHRPLDVLRSTASERNQQVRQTTSHLALAKAFFADQQGREADEAEAELLQEALKAVGMGGEQ